MTNQRVERGYLTSSLGSASHSGEHGFKTVPGLLKRVIEERAWEGRLIVETGEEFDGFKNFEAYVKANPSKGLGTDLDTIKRLVANDEELFQWVLAEERKAHPLGTNQYTEGVNIVNTRKRPQGNSKAYALQKLSDEGEIDLLEQVKGGKLSANEAMKQAGFRRPRIAIYLDDPESAAKTLLSNASPEFLDELRRLL